MFKGIMISSFDWNNNLLLLTKYFEKFGDNVIEVIESQICFCIGLGYHKKQAFRFKSQLNRNSNITDINLIIYDVNISIHVDTENYKKLYDCILEKMYIHEDFPEIYHKFDGVLIFDHPKKDDDVLLYKSCSRFKLDKENHKLIAIMDNDEEFIVNEITFEKNNDVKEIYKNMIEDLLLG